MRLELAIARAIGRAFNIPTYTSARKQQTQRADASDSWRSLATCEAYRHRFDAISQFDRDHLMKAGSLEDKEKQTANNRLSQERVSYSGLIHELNVGKT